MIYSKEIMFFNRLVLFPLLLIILLACGVVGITYATTKQPPTLQSITATVTGITSKISETSPKVQGTTQDASSQIQTLTQRASEVGQHAQKVLGTSIQVNEAEKKPIHQSALEYGRYIYCKQVVTDYETAAKEAKQSSDNN